MYVCVLWQAVAPIAVDDAGNRISFGRATGRYFAKILSAIILCIGFIMIGFTDKSVPRAACVPLIRPPRRR